MAPENRTLTPRSQRKRGASYLIAKRLAFQTSLLEGRLQVARIENYTVAVCSAGFGLFFVRTYSLPEAARQALDLGCESAYGRI